MTASGVALLAGCVLLVWWSSWRWAASARLPAFLDTLVAAGLLALVVVVATVLVVGGLLRALSPVPIAAAAVGVAACAAATTATTVRRGRIAASRRSGRAALRQLAGVLHSPLVLLLAVCAAGAFAYRTAIAVRFPALDWDALAYHLPTVDYWLQEHRVVSGHFSYWSQIHPAGDETVVAWMGVLTGSVRPVAAVQLAAALLGATSVVALCRGAHRSPRSSVVGGLVFVLAPIVLVQLSTAEVDILAAATLLATWHLLLVALRSPSTTGRRGFPAVALAGLGAGVAVGVKSTNLASVAVLTVVLLGTLGWRHLVREHDLRHGVRQMLLQGAAFVGPALALGGYWYARNAVTWGNPLYPLPVAGLPGDPATIALLQVDPRQVGTHNPYWALLVSWVSDLHWRSYFYGSATGGLGAAWLLVGAPCVLLGIVLAVRSRDRLSAWGFLLPGVLLLLVYPGAYHTRYTIFLLAQGGVGLAFVLDALPRWPRQALLAAVAATALFSAAAGSWLAVDLSGSDRGLTPRQVLALMRAPGSVRSDVGLRSAFTDVEKASPGATFVLPPEFDDFGQPWVLPHALWGDEVSRSVVTSATPIETPAQALQALRDHHAQYIVVTKGSPLETALLGSPGLLHQAFEVGWLAWAWAPGPGATGAPPR